MSKGGLANHKNKCKTYIEEMRIMDREIREKIIRRKEEERRRQRELDMQMNLTMAAPNAGGVEVKQEQTSVCGELIDVMLRK